MKVYRVEFNHIGIYNAVEKYCPGDDERRKDKPDGSWLPRVGEKYLQAKSFWTEKGFKKYQEFGLMDWHQSVLPKGQKIKTLKIKLSKQILYQDKYQVIV